MLIQIIHNTPLWVWGLLLALIALGVSQGVARTAGLRKVLILPAVMTGFSVFGMVSAFGWRPTLWLAWVVGGGMVGIAIIYSRLPAGTSYDRETCRFFLPASRWPLILILGIFLTKYCVGVALAMQAQLAQDWTFSHVASVLYGVFSGIFVAQAGRLWRLAIHPGLAQSMIKPATPAVSWRRQALLIAAAVLLVPSLLITGLIVFGGALPPSPLTAMGPMMGRVQHGLPDLSYFEARDGARLAFRLYPGTSGQRIAVLIHGSSADSHAMHGVARALVAQGITAYALDIRGHGASGRRGDVDYAGQLDDDLADFMTLLRSRHTEAKISLVGHSSGGGFALRTAGGRNRDLFDRYVLLAPMLHQDAPTARPNAGGWISAAKPRMIGIALLNSLGISWFDHLPVLFFALPPEASATHTTSYSYRLQLNFRPHLDYMGDVRAITRPVQVLVGANDEIFIADQYAPLLEPLQSRLQVKVLPGVNHLGMVIDPIALSAIVAAL